MIIKEITVILAAVIAAFVFAVAVSKVDMSDIKVVNATVTNITVIPGGFGYSQTNEVFFENGDRTIFGKDYRADVFIEEVEFEKILLNNSYQMTYQRVGPTYKWTLTNVTEVNK